jgi:hypothetical protein
MREVLQRVQCVVVQSGPAREHGVQDQRIVVHRARSPDLVVIIIAAVRSTEEV